MKKMIRFTTTALTIGMLAVTGTTAFATTNTVTDTTECRVELTEEQKTEMQTKMKERLAQELADGTLTQEQYDQRLSDLEAGKMSMRGGRGGDENSEKAELTVEQKAEMQTKMKARLADQLTSGTMTQEEYDQAISDLESGKMPERGDHGEKPELTDEQKTEQLTKMKEHLAQQLEDGKITQEQYDQMLSDIEAGKMPMRGHREKENETTAE